MLCKKVINKRYGNCAVIPYVNKQLAWNDKPVHLTPFNVKTIAKTVSQGLGNLKKRKAFDVFLSEYLQMGDTSNLANYTDIVVGSDQVWNVNLTNNDYTYFWKTTTEINMRMQRALEKTTFQKMH